MSHSHSRKVRQSGVFAAFIIDILLLADWMEIRTNHMVVITPKMNILQIPIRDKYYVPPSDPAALSRDKEFAAAKGFLSPRREVSVKSSDEDTTDSPVL